MLMQIRSSKVKMLNSIEDQLSATTKQTLAQNKVLAYELEYQSKQSEHLMLKIHGMQQNLQRRRTEFANHTIVKDELAKRTYFCQKVIQRYK